VKRAIEFGELLNNEQANRKHGELLNWLETKCGVAKRTAQRCQQLAKPENKTKIDAAMKGLDHKAVPALSLNKAVALIKNRRSSNEKPKVGSKTYGDYVMKIIEELKGMKLASAEDVVTETNRKLRQALAEMKRVTTAQN
jgi:hypothetical protein